MSYEIKAEVNGKEYTFESDVPNPSESDIMSAVGSYHQDSADQHRSMLDTLKNVAGNVVQGGEALSGNPVALISMLTENAKPIIDSAPVVGGIVGGAVAGPGGALLGGSAGEAFKQLDQRALGMDVPTTSGEAASSVGLEGLKQAAYDIGGRAILAPIFKGAEVLGQPIKTALADVTQGAIDKAVQLGMKLTPADGTGSTLLAKIESFLQSTPGGAGILNGVRNKQLELLTEEYDRLLSNGAPQQTTEQLGMRIKELAQSQTDALAQAKTLGLEGMGKSAQNAMGASSQTQEQAGTGAQTYLDNLLASTKQDVKNLYAAHKALVSENMPIASTNQLDATNTLYREIAKGNPALRNAEVMQIADALRAESNLGQTTFDRAYANRQALADMIRTETNVLPGGAREVTPKGRQLQILKNAIEQDLATASEKQGGKIKEAFDAAKAAHAERQQLIENPVLQDVLNSSPDQVVNKVIRPNGVTTIRGARTLLGDTQFKPVQDRFTTQLLGDGAFDPAKVSSQIRKYGDETLSELYGKDGLKQLKDLVSKAEAYKALPTQNQFVKTLLQKDPQNVLGYIIKPNNTENILAAKRIIGLDKWNEVADTWAQYALKDPATGQLSANRAKQLLKLGDATLAAAFGPAKYQEIKALSQLQSLLSGVDKLTLNTSKTAQAGITWHTFKDVLTHPIETGIKTVVPQQLAKAYASPAAYTYLTKGAFKVPPEAAPATLAALKGITNKTGVGNAMVAAFRKHILGQQAGQ